MIKYADFRQGKIRYFDSDGNRKSKGRVVVFLHGFLETLEMWRYYNKLPHYIRKISIDLPGHGKSDNFGYVHSMELMAESVYAVLKKERIRKIILIGHSMGGYAALAFAEMYPDMVKGLGLFFSTAKADTEEKKMNRDQAIRLVELDRQGFIRKAIPLLFAPDNVTRYSKSIAVLIKHAQRMGVQNIIAAIGGMRNRVNREIVLKFAPYPVCYIVGEEDPVLSAEDLRSQAQLPENGCFTLLKNTGHMGFIENKKQSFFAVKKFIYSVYYMPKTE